MKTSKRVCSKCEAKPTDGNPIRYTNGVATCDKCSGRLAKSAATGVGPAKSFIGVWSNRSTS